MLLKYDMLSSSDLKNKLVWKSVFSSYVSIILQGKKVKNSIDIMAANSINGPCTTRELAKFVLLKTPGHSKKISNKEARVKEQMFYKLLTGRFRKKTGRKKGDRYSGLISKDYIKKVGTKINDKGKNTNLYFLTLKGCFFVLGNNFSDDELRKFIQNAAKYHLFFSFLENLLQGQTSLTFVKQIFIKPVQDLGKKSILIFDGNIPFSFYFEIIAKTSGREIYKKMIHFNNEFSALGHLARMKGGSYNMMPHRNDTDPLLAMISRLLYVTRKRKSILDTNCLIELYGDIPNIPWRKKIVTELLGDVTKPYESLVDNSDEFRILLQILLHSDIAIKNAYGFEN